MAFLPTVLSSLQDHLGYIFNLFETLVLGALLMMSVPSQVGAPHVQSVRVGLSALS